MSDKVTTREMTAADLPQVARLHARVMGPGRFARTAYRVREKRPGGAGQVSGLSRAAFLGHRMIASVTFTDITVGGKAGAALLGPLAVDPEFTGQGYGRRLVAESLEKAKALGLKLIVLVGDEPYYGRLGFKRVPPGQILLPGPVDPARILATALEPGAEDAFSGTVSAA
jgi:predicted N-acetyltransferase YhbS